MNELSVDLDRYFALGRDVSITTLHDEQISGIVSLKSINTTQKWGIFIGNSMINKNASEKRYIFSNVIFKFFL